MSFFHIFALSRFPLKFFLGVSLSLILLTGCTSEQPVDWKACEEKLQGNQQSKTSNIPATEHTVVYLDTSKSMQGYVSPEGDKPFAVSPDGQTVFSKTLLELRSIVTTLSPNFSVVVRRVDSEVYAPSYTNLELSQAALNRGVYNGKETNLAGAIKEFNQPLTNENPENTNPPRFHILVTDGVQSSNQQRTDTSCEKGSDSTCVNTQILKHLNNGWGATIFGIKSEFQGTVYSEVNKSELAYSTNKKEENFRPFYLYIFSPDQAALDNLTQLLRQRLGELVKSPNSLREFSLTSAYTRSFSQIELNNTSKEFIELRKEKDDDKRPARIRVKVDVKTERDGLKPFNLKVKIPWAETTALAGTNDDLLKMIKWNLELIDGDKEDSKIRYPNLELTEKKVTEDGIELTFKTGWTKEAGEFGGRMYRLVGKFDPAQSALPWIKQWSTQVDTTTDNANKTLNLEGSLGNLWKQTAIKNETVSSGCIRVSTR